PGKLALLLRQGHSGRVACSYAGAMVSRLPRGDSARPAPPRKHAKRQGSKSLNLASRHRSADWSRSNALIFAGERNLPICLDELPLSAMTGTCGFWRCTCFRGVTDNILSLRVSRESMARRQGGCHPAEKRFSVVSKLRRVTMRSVS